MFKRYRPPVQGHKGIGKVNIRLPNTNHQTKSPFDNILSGEGHNAAEKRAESTEVQRTIHQQKQAAEAESARSQYTWNGGTKEPTDSEAKGYNTAGLRGRLSSVVDEFLKRNSYAREAENHKVEQMAAMAKEATEVSNDYNFRPERRTSFFDVIKGFFKGKPTNPPNEAIQELPANGTSAVGADGGPIFKEDIITFVKKELERRKEERRPLEQQWILNSNFIVGNQYCDINSYTGEIEQSEPRYDWMEREAFNRISPLIETRIANLKRIQFMMTVRPKTNESDDHSKAEVSTAILRHIQKDTDFETKKNTMIHWSELCGNAFCLSWWDLNKGEAHLVDGDTVCEGDLNYGLLTPYEVYPESVYKQWIDTQRSIIIAQVKTVEEIYDAYGIKVDGGTAEVFALTPMPVGGGLGYSSTVNTLGHRKVENCAQVITYFERRSRDYPKGRLIIMVDDELIHYGYLPYDNIPLVQITCKESPGMFFGKSVIEELIPLQRAYNACVNRIHEYIRGLVVGGYMAEEGSIDIDEYEVNGKAPEAILTYKQGHTPPTPTPNGSLPSEVMREKAEIERDMEYVAAVSQLMAIGATPSGVTSGAAIENLREIDNTRLSLTGDNVRNAIVRLAKIWLEIIKRHALTNRVLRYTGTNGMGSVIVWSKDDINSFDIEYDTENELLLSEEMQKQRFIEAFNMGLFADSNGVIPERFKHRALELMKTGNYRDIMNLNELQAKAADRENIMFEENVIPQISEFDNHEIHAEEHLRYILQMKFKMFKMRKPEYAAQMENHLRAHLEIRDREIQAQINNMTVNGQ